MNTFHAPFWRSVMRSPLGPLVFLLLFVSFVDANPQRGSDIDSFVLVTSNTETIRLSAIVEQDKEGTTIKGALTRRPPSKRFLYGHIDLEVTAGTGELLLVDYVPFRPNPVPQRLASPSRFTWRVPPQIAPGSRIEMRFHAGTHPTT